MAERSIIDGFGPGVSKWASEATAKEIANTLSDIKSLTAGQKSKIEDMAKAAAKSKGGKYDTEAFKELTDAMDDLTEEVEDATEAKREERKETTLGSQALSGFGNAVLSASKSLGGMFVSALGITAGAMYQQADLAVQLNQAGIQLSKGTDGVVDGLTNFGLAAAEANLSFSELAAITKDYGAVMNRFGIRAFSETSRAVNRSLDGLGLTAGESAELVAEYLQSQRFMTYQESMTQAQRQRAAAEMIKEIDQYSQVFGESRESLMKTVSGSMQDVDVQAFLQNLDPGSAIKATMQSIATQLSGSEFQGLREGLLGAIVDPVTQRSETFDALMQAGAIEAGNALINFSEAVNAGDAEQSQVMFDNLMQSLRESDVDLSQLIGEQGRSARALINQAKLYEEQMSSSMGQFGRESINNVANMQNAFREVTQFFQRVSASVLGDPGVIDALNDSMELFTDFLASPEGKTAIQSMQNSLANLFKALGPALKASIPFITSMFDKLTEWAGKIEEFTEGGDLTKVFDNLDFSSIPAKIGIGIGIALAGGAAAAIIGGAIASGIGSLLSKVAFGKSGSGGLFGNMFKGVGKGIGGALTALAAGLSAFGKAGPAVLKGAAVIAAVIPIIGAGIAGATWIMGKALPTFAEGLAAFEDLNGDNLAKVGDGVMRLGAGLAGMAAAKIGDFFASIGDSIMSFFTGEKQGPIEMLRQFSGIADEVGPGLSNLGKHLQNFVPSLSNLLDAGGKAASFDLDDFVEQLEDLSDLDVNDVTLTIPTVFANSNQVDTKNLEQQINTALGNIPGTYEHEVITTVDGNSSAADQKKMVEDQIHALYRDLENAEKLNMPYEDIAEIQDEINLFNDMLTGVNQINGIRLDGERITREMSQVAAATSTLASADASGAKTSANALADANQSLVKSLSPRDIASLESKRSAMIRFLDKAEQMGVPDSSTGVKHAKRRIEEINNALSAAQTLDTGNLENAGSVDSLYVMADRVDDSSTQLSKSISKYVSGLIGLEKIQPVDSTGLDDYTPSVEQLQTKVTGLWQTLERLEQSGANTKITGRVQEQIDMYNRMITGMTKVNGTRLDGEPVTREIAMMQDSAESVANADFTGASKAAENLQQVTKSMASAMSPTDIARLESRRDALTQFIDKADAMGNGNMSGVKTAQRRIEQINSMLNEATQTDAAPAEFNGLVADIGLSSIPEQIDNERETLEVAITRYMNELLRLEDIKPISQSARVEYSPIVSDDTSVSESRPTVASNQSVQNTPSPLQISQPDNEPTSQSDAAEDKPNPEISSTNVAQRVPETENEINSLMKEQNKILTGLTIAMDTNNKRLKSLVRINEEKGA